LLQEQDGRSRSRLWTPLRALNEVIDLAEITRRDFFRKLYSKDTAKDVFGTVYGFKHGLDNASKPSGDEAIFKIVKNRKRAKYPINKEKGGIKNENYS